MTLHNFLMITQKWGAESDKVSIGCVAQGDKVEEGLDGCRSWQQKCETWYITPKWGAETQPERDEVSIVQDEIRLREGWIGSGGWRGSKTGVQREMKWALHKEIRLREGWIMDECRWVMWWRQRELSWPVRCHGERLAEVTCHQVELSSFRIFHLKLFAAHGLHLGLVYVSWNYFFIRVTIMSRHYITLLS